MVQSAACWTLYGSEANRNTTEEEHKTADNQSLPVDPLTVTMTTGPVRITTHREDQSEVIHTY